MDKANGAQTASFWPRFIKDRDFLTALAFFVLAIGIMLGTGELTGNQIVTIQRELAVAFVALDRPDLAVEAFAAALERQPDLELYSRDTSPTVQRALTGAREAHAERQRAAPPEPTPDGGVADGGEAAVEE